MQTKDENVKDETGEDGADENLAHPRRKHGSPHKAPDCARETLGHALLGVRVVAALCREHTRAERGYLQRDRARP